MIKVATKIKRQDSSDLIFWLLKTASERLSCVEILRREFYGDSKGLQRVAKVVQRSKH